MSNIELKLFEINQCIIKYIDETAGVNTLPGLYTGDMGIAMFLSHYNRFKQDDKTCIYFEKTLNRSFDVIGGGYYVHTYCSGISGAFYSMLYLKNKLSSEIDILDAHEGYRDFLIERMVNDMNHGHYDFMHNALGVGLYLLKSRDSYANTYINLLIDILYIKSLKDDYTVKWSSILNMENKIGYNICMSHGMSSIVVFLSRMIQKHQYNEKAIELLKKSVNYILNQEIDKNVYGSYFPSTSIETETEISKSRMAWCYGDLGVASAIWQAGKALNNQTWKDKAIEVFMYAATRTDLQSNSVRDAGICHGTAGIAQIFKRMYIETGIEDFKVANEYWINETLKMATFDDGAAGYKAYHLNGQDVEWKTEYNFLEGIAGIGLSLISYLSDNPEDSAWDEILLLS